MTANDFWLTLTLTLHQHSQCLFESDKLPWWTPTCPLTCLPRSHKDGWDQTGRQDGCDVTSGRKDDFLSALGHRHQNEHIAVLQFIPFVRSALLSSIPATLSGCQNCHMSRRRLVPTSATCHRWPQWKVILAVSLQQVCRLGEWLLKQIVSKMKKKRLKSENRSHEAWKPLSPPSSSIKAKWNLNVSDWITGAPFMFINVQSFVGQQTLFSTFCKLMTQKWRMMFSATWISVYSDSDLPFFCYIFYICCCSCNYIWLSGDHYHFFFGTYINALK